MDALIVISSCCLLLLNDWGSGVAAGVAAIFSRNQLMHILFFYYRYPATPATLKKVGFCKARILMDLAFCIYGW
jgi:hypothetical protein